MKTPADKQQTADKDLFGEVPAKLRWTLNQSELAEIFGVSTVTIKTWERKGMPVLKVGDHGQEAQYTLPDVVEWRVKQLMEQAVEPTKSGTLTDETIRRTRLDADLKELELERARHKLFDGDLIQRSLADAHLIIRTRLQALPRPLAQEIDDPEERIRLEMLWDARIRQVLESLANYELPFTDPDDTGAASRRTSATADPGQSERPGAAAPADRQPVGRGPAHRQPRGRRASRRLAQ